MELGCRVKRLRILGGSWVFISGVISPLMWAITIVTLLKTPLRTTHEPPSTGLRPFFAGEFQGLQASGFGVGLLLHPLLLLPQCF